MARLVRHRALHFVAGGILLHAALGSSVSPPEPVRITPEAQTRLRSGWVAATGREPTEAEFAAVLGRELDDEILFREALAAGLHRRDAVVRQRLLMNMRFLEPDTHADDDTLVERAERMGMHRNDLVVRRRLVQLMEFALGDVPADAPVSAEELLRMYSLREAELRQPAQIGRAHV